MNPTMGSKIEMIRGVWLSMISKGFDKTLQKVKLISAADGHSQAEFTVSEEMTNYGGTLHGGMTASIVDIVSTIGLMTSRGGTPGMSVNMSINYLKAAPLGEEVVVDSKALKVGKTLAFLNVELKKKKSGDLIATGTHVKYIGG